MKIFVVTRQGWDYNDEYYYRSEYGGGEPIKAFKDLAEAERFAKQSNIQECKEILSSDEDEIRCFLGEGVSISDCLNPDYKWRSVTTPREDCERLLSHFDVFSNYSCDNAAPTIADPVAISDSMHSKIPDDDWLLLSEALSLVSFTVNPVEFVE